jgi:hypothetical protein
VVDRTSGFRRFAILLPPVVAVYLLFDRAAAYLHLPGTPVYLAEGLLAVGMVAWARSPRLVWSVIRADPVLCALMTYFLWGVLRAIPNLATYGTTFTVRDSSLWYYSLFAVLVVTSALVAPEFPFRLAEQTVRFAPWLLAWLPFAVVLGAASGTSARVPFSSVSVLSHKDGNVAVVAFLSLLALCLLRHPGRSSKSRRAWALVAIATVFIAATQNRGGLVAVTVAAVIGLIMIRGLGRLAARGLLVIAVLSLVGSAVLPHGAGRSTRSVSSSQFVANIESLAGVNKSSSLRGTEQARQRQWSYVVSLERTEGKLPYGWGPGPNLGFGQATGTGDETLRVPHNSHVDVLARLGLIGLAIWIFTWVAWSWRLLRARSRLTSLRAEDSRRILEVCFLAAIAILVNAFFDPSLEGAQVAVLLWTIFGVGAALSNPRWNPDLIRG